MRKTIIMDLPMTRDPKPIVYKANTSILKIDSEKTKYAIKAFLAKNMCADDEVNFILLAKHSDVSNTDEHKKAFVREIDEANIGIGAKIQYHFVDSAYSQEQQVHEKLLGDIIELIHDQDHIIADITYGPKDEPILIFAVLSFAEKFLDCEIEHILYGQVNFVNGKPEGPGVISDMIPLYTLSTLVEKLPCSNSDVARKTLKAFLKLGK